MAVYGRLALDRYTSSTGSSFYYKKKLGDREKKPVPSRWSTADRTVPLVAVDGAYFKIARNYIQTTSGGAK